MTLTDSSPPLLFLPPSSSPPFNLYPLVSILPSSSLSFPHFSYHDPHHPYVQPHVFSLFTRFVFVSLLPTTVPSISCFLSICFCISSRFSVTSYIFLNSSLTTTLLSSTRSSFLSFLPTSHLPSLLSIFLIICFPITLLFSSRSSSISRQQHSLISSSFL